MPDWEGGATKNNKNQRILLSEVGGYSGNHALQLSYKSKVWRPL
jgi:hypothetical protein